MQFTDNNSSHPDLQGVQVRLADHLQLGERVSYYIVLIKEKFLDTTYIVMFVTSSNQLH